MFGARLLRQVLLGALLGGVPLAVVYSDLDERRALELVCLAGAAWLFVDVYFARRTAHCLTEAAEFVGEVGDCVASRKSLHGKRLPPKGASDLKDLVRATNRMAANIETHDRAVQREMAQRRAILASMADGVLAVDGEQRIMLVNETARGLLEFAVSAPEGELIGDVIRQSDVLELIDRCVTDRESRRSRTVVFLGIGGAQHVLELRASPLQKTPDGGCVLVIEDRTEIERLERVRRDFVANVSHELKTPLTSIRGYLETVRDDPDLPPDMRDRFLGKSIRNADRLAAIIGDLLTLARAEGAGQVKRDEVDLRELAVSVLAEVAPLASEAGIEIKLDAPSKVRVLGDRTALLSALLNLVENALKYSPAGTCVRVEVSLLGGSARLAVDDQGPGISEQHLERIFERFYRIDKDRSRQLGGTGLGLSIVRHVALSHGGQARVLSTVGKGSRFWLELPAIADA